MNLNDSDIHVALARLEGWLQTMQGPDGFYGPVVGLRSTAMTWCGAGYDWRWEGLLDGWTQLHRKTNDTIYLDRIDNAMYLLQKAQLANGAFRNSAFENNPFEGGMPYEPILISAVMRALHYMNEIGHPWPSGAAEMVERFVEERLIKELWNKTLKTFNSWLQSDFDRYSPPAVAAIVETLCLYAPISPNHKRLAHYIEGAANALLASQIRSGPLAGALPLSNQSGADVVPSLSARGLPAFAHLHAYTGNAHFVKALTDLATFIRSAMQRDGGAASLMFAHRPHRITPCFIGATADILRSFTRANILDPALEATQLSWILQHQTASGAFETAVGFGSNQQHGEVPDWRDVIPVCGWVDKVYALLCTHVQTPIALQPGTPVSRTVTVHGESAIFREDADQMSLSSDQTQWFSWRKRTICPTTCGRL